MNDILTILLVDDDVAFRESMADVLNEMGFVVTEASDGTKAIEFIKNDKYDVILMDVKMPGINGIEAFRRIKHIRSLSRTIFITGYPGDKIVEEAMKEGAAAVLSKPVDMLQLENLLAIT